MGVFYYIHSVALIEDLPLEEHYDSPKEFYAAADVAYSQVIITFLSLGLNIFFRSQQIVYTHISTYNMLKSIRCSVDIPFLLRQNSFSVLWV